MISSVCAKSHWNAWCWQKQNLLITRKNVLFKYHSINIFLNHHPDDRPNMILNKHSKRTQIHKVRPKTFYDIAPPPQPVSLSTVKRLKEVCQEAHLKTKCFFLWCGCFGLLLIYFAVFVPQIWHFYVRPIASYFTTSRRRRPWTTIKIETNVHRIRLKRCIKNSCLQ